MESVFYVQLKNFNFATFSGHLGFLRKTENVNISETARDRVILTEFWTRMGGSKVSYTKLKNFNFFATFGGHLGFLRKTQKC